MNKLNSRFEIDSPTSVLSINEIINPLESYLSQTMCYEQDACQGFLRKLPKK